MSDKKELRLVVDVNSLEFTAGGGRYSPADLIELMNESGILFYRSIDGDGRELHPPQVIDVQLTAIDVMTVDGQKQLEEYFNTEESK